MNTNADLTSPVQIPDPMQIPNAPNTLKSKSPMQIAGRRFLKNKLAMFGVICLFVIVVLCVGAPLFAHQDPTNPDLMSIESPPSSAHLLGTDDSGRDVWARVLFGGRASILVGVCSMLITLGIGVVIGAVSGY